MSVGRLSPGGSSEIRFESNLTEPPGFDAYGVLLTFSVRLQKAS